MQHALLCLCLAMLLAGSSATDAKQSAQQQTKPKRDAGLSFGSHGSRGSHGSHVSHSYHGPSYKYLPPAATGLSHSYEHGYHALHGNSLSASSGYDYAQLDAQLDSHHQPHYQAPSYHHQHHHQAPTRHVYSSYQQAPKLETYIVQGASHAAAPSHGYKYPSHGSYASLLGSHKLHSGYRQSYGYHAQPQHSRPSYASHAHAHGHSHGAAHGAAAGYSYAPPSSHAPSSLELELNSLSPGAGYHYAQELSEQPASGAGYSYESPSLHSLPSSYGVPLLPNYESEDKQPHEEQPPAYALGHKGLGHFSYTASKPQALHTDAIGQHSAEVHAPDLASEIHKSPFKPSVFLGAKHEISSNSEEAAGYDYVTPSTQYLQPPTAGDSNSGNGGGGGGGGYDYQAPSLLYAAPGHAGDSATPIFEPDSTYLPPAESAEAPQISYVPAAAPNHSYQQH